MRSTKSFWRNWRGLMLTHRLNCAGSTRPSAISCLKAWQASSTIQVPTSRINPLSSSTLMNSVGDCAPSSGWFQRTSASAPTMRLSRASTWGW
ncbi:hypothetical protein D3C76_1537090 [compost metagenome]